MKSPCHNCPKRIVGCHATCTNYAEFRVKVESIRKAEAEWKRKQNDRFNSPHKKRMMSKFADRSIDSRR